MCCYDSVAATTVLLLRQCCCYDSVATTTVLLQQQCCCYDSVATTTVCSHDSATEKQGHDKFAHNDTGAYKCTRIGIYVFLPLNWLRGRKKKKKRKRKRKRKKKKEKRKKEKEKRKKEKGKRKKANNPLLEKDCWREIIYVRM
ncbi:hypothetical protein POVWA2_036240 [Plasmodium ovale wallikeri]|uniref:Uncharacterized protein n=1 Tax=Plasmodium ovale wallikeri TaxID=864142 RepID=A0A1A8Z4B8_PLAOA|nr:hypothetical protein POVWA2_036240 [Plasmodium ovale wallikeri]